MKHSLHKYSIIPILKQKKIGPLGDPRYPILVSPSHKFHLVSLKATSSALINPWLTCNCNSGVQFRCPYMILPPDINSTVSLDLRNDQPFFRDIQATLSSVHRMMPKWPWTLQRWKAHPGHYKSDLLPNPILSFSNFVISSNAESLGGCVSRLWKGRRRRLVQQYCKVQAFANKR